MRELELQLGTFTRPVLLDVARRDGSLAEAGLVIHETPVVSSPAQFASLEAGEFDAVFTSPDNVIAYRFATKNPLGRMIPATIVGAIDRGLGLSLCLAPSIDSTDQLHDAVLGVDVPQSGFAFVAYELLARAGLAPGDYRVEALGSTPRRATALERSECAVTVLNAGNEIRAIGAGCTLHSRVTDVGPYLGTVIAALDTDDPDRRDALERFTAVMYDTVRRITAGEREDLVVDSATELLELTRDEAVEHYRCLLDPANGYITSGRIDTASIETLLTLRRRYLPSSDLDGVEDRLTSFVDPRILA